MFTLHLTESLGATHQATVYGGDFDGVLAISGELMTNQCSTTSSEGQPLDLVVLCEVLSNTVQRLDRSLHVANCQPADLARRGYICFQQCRRQSQCCRHVVEAPC